MKLRFYDFMRAGHVRRWHIVHTIRDQTLAEHSYLVTIIALELFQRIVGFDDPYECQQLTLGALFHDAPEIRLGDTPTPAKAFIRSMAGEGVFKSMEQELMPEIPYGGGVLPDRLIPFIKMADLIADAWWMNENKAGVHSEVVAKGNNRAMMEYVLSMENAQPKGGWVEAVNKVLIELGMPYISASMRETPP